MNDDWKNFEPRKNAPIVATDAPIATKPLKTPLARRSAPEMREAASKRLDLALDAVEAVLRDPEARHSDKLAAAVFIRDTSHGKPTERVEHTVGIMQIVMEMNKSRSLQPAGDSLLSTSLPSDKIIDNQ